MKNKIIDKIDRLLDAGAKISTMKNYKGISFSIGEIKVSTTSVVISENKLKIDSEDFKEIYVYLEEKINTIKKNKEKEILKKVLNYLDN